MKIIHFKNMSFSKEFANSTVLALGFFDGVHLGHRQLIMKAKEISKRKNLKLAVMTFYPHPKEILQGGKFSYLMTLEAKIEKMSQLGVDYLYVVDFNKEFSKLSPETFVKQYISDLNVRHVVAGFDYTYGSKGMGTMETMKEHGDGKFEVTVLPEVDMNGIKISSTHIRNLLFKGDVEQVKSFMGFDYETEGQFYSPYSVNQFQNSYAGTIALSRNVYAFVPDNHCSIPCTGKYLVKVQSSNYTETATAEVFEGMNYEKEILIQLCNHSKLSYNGKVLRIMWLERLETEGIANEQQIKELVPNN